MVKKLELINIHLQNYNFCKYLKLYNYYMTTSWYSISISLQSGGGNFQWLF